MGLRLRAIVGTLKDGAALLSSAGPTVNGGAAAAVLRATAHLPSSAPPSPKHLNALLRFGGGSRPTAASLVTALIARLCATRDAAVALKCLICVHFLARHGSFILKDQLLAALYAAGRNPLNLAGFLDRSAADSWVVSRLVRWLARVLERLLEFHRAAGFFLNGAGEDHEAAAEERLAALTNAQVLKEMDALVGIVEEIRGAPEMFHAAAAALVREDMAAARKEILIRMKEIQERSGWLSSGDGVQLGCLVKRLEACKRAAAPPGEVEIIELSEGDWSLWEAVAAIKTAVARLPANGRVRRDGIGGSERIGDRRVIPSSVDSVLFGSTRWHAV